MNDFDSIIDEAVNLAEKWQVRSNEILNIGERFFQNKIKRLLRRSMDKVILAKLIDQSFRSKQTYRVADQITNLLKKFGIPEFMSFIERMLIRLFVLTGRFFSIISVPLMIMFIRKGSSGVILAGEENLLQAHLRKRKLNGVRMNINHLGEAVLGEKESMNRLETYTEDLKNPDVEYISIKISTIYSQISSLAFEHTVSVLEHRLAQLYRIAQKHFFTRPDGTRVCKFVNLDMEEYRDLSITVEAFRRTLDRKEFKDCSAGIVLQSYLPDSFHTQKRLTEWARERFANGGAPIKIRIVKGANLEMERLESTIRNWPLATYGTKLEVDANYKRMVEYGMRPENIRAVHLGIASHNLFELAFAYVLAKDRKVDDFFTFEMLEGMADHVRRAVQETTGDMLLYAPVALKDQFINAIAYLIRRLDENTGEENFLRYANELDPGSEEWSFLKQQFIESCHHIDLAGKEPNRRQDRTMENYIKEKGAFYEVGFDNEPDTDWSLLANGRWAEAIKEKWKKRQEEAPMEIPLVVAGREIYEGGDTIDCIDPSRVSVSGDGNICVAKCTGAVHDDVEAAVKIAREDPDGWRTTDIRTRHKTLSRVAMEIRKSRGDLIGSTAANTGKIFTETDIEVSEAVDFVEYYPHSLKAFIDIENVKLMGKGVGLVISPWNFPVAIPCGGITAALAAGNTVIFKPASAALLPAWVLCQCFWNAGVSKNVLQFLPAEGQSAGSTLAGHPGIDFIILTGGTDTGLNILQNNPGVFFTAETGGKNATIVTSMADRDQAISNVMHSAFSNCGQKCSATSLLILEKEVFNDKNFKDHLMDAAGSWRVGSAWDFENKMGPLIHPPSGQLKAAMTTLHPGEKWLLKPKNVDDNPYIWTPGIKWDVTPGSITHMTEFFGPLLGVMEAENLEHAIKMANQTGYGLTSGLESLDTREQEIWKENIKAGNLYINRGTTGAVVLKQPFGGIGKSAIGAGIKAGGPNYAVQFMNAEDASYPFSDMTEGNHPLLDLIIEWSQKQDQFFLKGFEEDIKKTLAAVVSYLSAREDLFSREQDHFKLKGQDNILRYLPIGTVVIRIHEDDTLFEILARIAAARISGCRLILSARPGIRSRSLDFILNKEGRLFSDNAEVLYQSHKDLIKIMPEIDGIRYAAPDRVPWIVLKDAADSGFYIARSAVVMEGRIELLQYYHEQSICNNYHRYGYLGERGLEQQGKNDSGGNDSVI